MFYLPNITGDSGFFGALLIIKEASELSKICDTKIIIVK